MASANHYVTQRHHFIPRHGLSQTDHVSVADESERLRREQEPKAITGEIDRDLEGSLGDFGVLPPRPHLLHLDVEHLFMALMPVLDLDQPVLSIPGYDAI